MSTYRAYLRTFDGNVPADTKTVTPDAGAAFAAFAALVNRADLDGQKLAAALTNNNRQMAFHRFDRSPGDADYWRDKLHELPIASRHDDVAEVVDAHLAGLEPRGAAMTPADLAAWRAHMGYSQRAAARALGMSLPGYQRMERGADFATGKPVEIDRRTALACGAIAAGIGEYQPQAV